MPRYPGDYKAQTRRRIIETAARRLKRDGIDGSGIAVLMKDAGLTNGAFYSHFSSKSDLVASVVAEEMAAQVALIESALDDPHSLARFIEGYLSTSHRDDTGTGCPAAALLEEIAHSDPAVRNAYEVGAQRILEVVAAHLIAAHGADPGTAWDRAVGIYAVLVATVQLSRAVNDSSLSDRVLRAGVSSALTLVPAQNQSSAQPSTR